MSFLEDPDKAYKPALRLTATRGFGNTTLSGSFTGSDPSELLTSVEKDLSDYRACVDQVGAVGHYRPQESQQLRATIKEKLSTVEQDIKEKRVRGESAVAVKRLSQQLDNHLKTFNKLIKLEKKKMENAQEESHLSNSFSGSDPAMTDAGGDTLAQEAMQEEESALQIREKQAEEIAELERDIVDLNDISKNLNEVVVAQGEDIDRIEKHTEKAAARTEKATIETTNAVAIKRHNRTLLIIILSVGGAIAVFLILLVIILAAVLSNNS